MHYDAAAGEGDYNPVFGVPLATAVERSKCHDGLQLPVVFRECIDYIEEFGQLLQQNKFSQILRTDTFYRSCVLK